MPCRKCIEYKQNFHSFEKIGILADGKTTIFYTSPASTSEPEDSPEAIDFYLQHFEETRPNQWIWVFDCQGMKSRDLLKNSGKRLTDAIQKNYFETLAGIYIVNPTWAMKTLIAFISPFVLKETRSKLHVCPLGAIDAITRLQKIGVSGTELSQLTRLFQRVSS